MSESLPPIPNQPLDPTSPTSVAMWKKQFFEPLAKSISKIGTMTWAALDKTASSLADLAKRDHSMLTKLLGWDGSEADRHIKATDGENWNVHVDGTGSTHHGVDHDATYAALNGNATENFSASLLTADTVVTGKIGTAEAPAWQLGTVKTATVAAVTTSYVEVKIGATVVKLAMVSTV